MPYIVFVRNFIKILLNSARLGDRSFFLIQPYGYGFVIAMPHWLFSFILIIFNEILFVFFFSSINKSNISVLFSFLLVNTSVSKASLVLTQLNHPINVFSNTLTCSVSGGKGIQHLLLFLWTHPLKLLAELYLRGLYLKNFSKRKDCCSIISDNIMVSWKL